MNGSCSDLRAKVGVAVPGNSRNSIQLREAHHFANGARSLCPTEHSEQGIYKYRQALEAISGASASNERAPSPGGG